MCYFCGNKAFNEIIAKGAKKIKVCSDCLKKVKNGEIKIKE